MRNRPLKTLNKEEEKRYEAFVASIRFEGHIEPENKILQSIGFLTVISLILFADAVLLKLGF